ncbi:peptidylprolyl isomerase [Holotrichia oblita]|uniref:Peptidylprolyl isomerase n=2 Tax=Holotrichia oblita TaxID=644536 RepID=A0ACB9TNR6_HOLOL|nr:peptidylprolyl isomerase [Holotrichia oblita]KAI4468417.1 peptidylprolyl isomerase [Holotrichia oblita]
MGETWISPDQRIQKYIISMGKNGLKPTENCECIMDVSASTYDVKRYNESSFVVGDSSDSFERLLDILLTTMNEGEKAKVVFKLKEKNVEFTLELIEFKSDGFIFEWDAKKKFELASKHKERGTELFKIMHYIDASHRFSKAIKLLSSIPIAVDKPPTVIDDLPICEVYSLKTVLCNNLASCYLKHRDYEVVIELCKRVLQREANNVKALYKMAVSYYEVHDYHKALETLEYVLKLDPENKAAADRMKDFTQKVNETNAKVNAMFKKMFT